MPGINRRLLLTLAAAATLGLAAGAAAQTPEPFDSAALAQGIGSQADFLRDELVVRGLWHLSGWAADAAPATDAALKPLECLANDIRLDIQKVESTYNPAALRLSDGLRKLYGEVGPDGDGMVARLKTARADLNAGRCLADLAENKLVGAETRAPKCHEQLDSAWSLLLQVDQESAGLWPVARTEWIRIRDYLTPIAQDKNNPDHDKAAALLGYLQQRLVWYWKHPIEARTALHAPLHGTWKDIMTALALVAEDPARGTARTDAVRVLPRLASEPTTTEPTAAYAARAALRRGEIDKANRLFGAAFALNLPVSFAWRTAEQAAVAVDLASQAWRAGGPDRRASEIEGSRQALNGFLDLMRAWKDLGRLGAGSPERS